MKPNVSAVTHTHTHTHTHNLLSWNKIIFEVYKYNMILLVSLFGLWAVPILCKLLCWYESLDDGCIYGLRNVIILIPYWCDWSFQSGMCTVAGYYAASNGNQFDAAQIWSISRRKPEITFHSPLSQMCVPRDEFCYECPGQWKHQAYGIIHCAVLNKWRPLKWQL
jgi:hypothetical protein